MCIVDVTKECDGRACSISRSNCAVSATFLLEISPEISKITSPLGCEISATEAAAEKTIRRAIAKRFFNCLVLRDKWALRY